MRNRLKFRIVGFVVLLSLLLYGCTTIQVQPKPIEQTPVQNVTLTSPSPCASDETFFPNFSFVEKCQPTSDVKVCKAVGGNWNVFGNGCGDSCGEKPRICTLAFEAACDCGTTKCYGNIPCNAPEGQSCPAVVRLGCISDTYEPYATPKEACEATGGNWTIVEPNWCKTDEECQSNSKIVGCIKFVGDSGTTIGCNKINHASEPAEMCPSFAPPVCEGGKLAFSGYSESGCMLPPRCVLPSCQCPSPSTFGLQGCKVHTTETQNMMSIAGGWN